MYVERTHKKQGKKVYEQILLRESYRAKQDGHSRVCKRTLLNLTQFPKEQVEAIEWALKNPSAMRDAVLHNTSMNLQEGKSVGAVFAIVEIARRIGLFKVLGVGRQGQLALWQIVTRVLEQGSRLSSIRLHEVHALADVLEIEKGFDEDDLYENLAWLSDHQRNIENKLFAVRHGGNVPKLFLYDVTSSYLEGDCNAFANYGYPRDGKKKKKQIVIGLLCDECGEPVSVEVFTGNTQDPKTFASQVKKVAQRFGCEKVTFVGDRGMIKQAQKDELTDTGFYYITALTKPQIEKLLRTGVLQMSLFDDEVCEVDMDTQRLILRRNPVRAEEVASTRQSKNVAVSTLVEKQNVYLAEHRRAKAETALKRVRQKITRLHAGHWLQATCEGRLIKLEIDESAFEAESMLDGCYVITTDVPAADADKEIIHARYKDLTHVERGFRISKTGHLELRPIHVRKEKSTRGHVLVVMLAYLIRREFERLWASFDVTVEEGLDALKTLCVMHVTLDDGRVFHQIPTPREQSRALIEALSITLPPIILERNLRVATKHKLPSQRSIH